MIGSPRGAVTQYVTNKVWEGKKVPGSRDYALPKTAWLDYNKRNRELPDPQERLILEAQLRRQ